MKSEDAIQEIVDEDLRQIHQQISTDVKKTKLSLIHTYVCLFLKVCDFAITFRLFTTELKKNGEFSNTSKIL